MENGKKLIGDKEAVRTLCERFAKEKDISPDEVLMRLASVGCEVVLAEEVGGFGLVVMPGKVYKKISPFKDNENTSETQTK
jgi:hypothetical protein